MASLEVGSEHGDGSYVARHHSWDNCVWGLNLQDGVAYHFCAAKATNCNTLC